MGGGGNPTHSGAPHIVDLPVPEESLATCIRRQRPDAVVFGHTHKAIRQTLGGVRISIPVCG